MNNVLVIEVCKENCFSKPFPTHPGPLVWAFCHLQSEEGKRFCALQAYVKTNQVVQVEN